MMKDEGFRKACCEMAEEIRAGADVLELYGKRGGTLITWEEVARELQGCLESLDRLFSFDVVENSGAVAPGPLSPAGPGVSLN